MKTAFDPKTSDWKIKWPGRVSQYDLVYLAPPEEPTQGIPLGNGDLGALCWCSDSKLIFALNKCDLWDDSKFEKIRSWHPDEEEFSTTLRHACRVIIDFKLPVFDICYLSDFRGRLSLADASMTIKARSPFGSIEVKAFIHHDTATLRLQVKNGLNEPVPIEVATERLGSRTFAHWYSIIRRDAKLGLSGTSGALQESTMLISHELTSGTFAVAAKVLAENASAVTYNQPHSRALSAVIDHTEKEFTYIAAVTEPMDKDAPAAACEMLDSVTSYDTDVAAHRKAWKTFWLRSLMDFGDDYLNNLWHLAMYYANASQRGKYPGRFIDALWGWNRDFRAWNYYYHWNQQQLYWPLNAAGHHDLLESYLEYRFAALPNDCNDARDLFKASGAFVSDVCDRRGFNAAAASDNHTPVAQIALDFYRQYLYTGDVDFLRNRALPYVIEAAKFFESLFTKESDGKFHAKSGTAYEGWILLKDCITELACAKSLFAAAIELCEIAGHSEPRLPHWQDILDNLVPLPKIEMDEAYLDKKANTFKLGLFKNDKPCSKEIFSCGLGIEAQTQITSLIPRRVPAAEKTDDVHQMIQKRENGEFPVMYVRDEWFNNEGFFPWSEFATVFPEGPITLEDRSSDDFKAAVNTAKLYTPAGMGWDPMPIVLARLGLGRELSQVLPDFPDQWQIYPNGFTQCGIRENMKSEENIRFYRNKVRDADVTGPAHHENKTLFPAWPFRHASLEAMYILPTAMNEALLQSCGGVIRVAPAVDNKQNARFTLHATNGIVVSAQIVAGKVCWVHLKALRPVEAVIYNPWSKTNVETLGSTESTNKKKLVIPLKRNQTVLLTPQTDKAKFETQPEKPRENQLPKKSRSGLAKLGVERLF
ncbi:MAG: hypothetical protein JW936_08855 [Sedimentisphaerales bacterium]|nr:hypothetical protein [Sedimentisphaerales bacterium]